MTDSTVRMRPRPDQVARAFMTPKRPEVPVPLLIHGSETLRVPTPEGEVVLQRAGSGPAVLLLHGWEGQPSDLAAFVPPLLEAGCCVVAMHLPAHGESPGKQTSIPQSARAVRAVAATVGRFQGAIAHSVGSAVLVEAMHAGAPIARAVMIAAPARLEHYVRSVAASAGLDDEGTAEMIRLLSEAIGADVRHVSLPARAAQRHEPALFIHSADDRVVSIDDSLASADAWAGARHLRAEGLGHRRVLSDPAIVKAAVAFVVPHARPSGP